MVLCLMVGCSNKTGKRSKNDREIVNFYRVSRVITNHSEFVEELSATRRRLWISAINRADITEKKAWKRSCCSRHLVSGHPAKDWDRIDIDWIPTQNLGHSKRQQTSQVNVDVSVVKKQSSKKFHRSCRKSRSLVRVSREFLMTRKAMTTSAIEMKWTVLDLTWTRNSNWDHQHSWCRNSD